MIINDTLFEHIQRMFHLKNVSTNMSYHVVSMFGHACHASMADPERSSSIYVSLLLIVNPYAPCMECLPTFTLKNTQM